MSNVREFGARGDGVMDDTEAIRHALADGDGVLEFPPGDYVVSQTIVVDFSKQKRCSIVGSAGTAKIKMTGAGPTFHFKGTHEKSADPAGFTPHIWSHERMPTASHIEIEGAHPEASGFWAEGTMEPTFVGVLLRELKDGIRIFRRARNVLISHCHIYHNRGVGVFLDHVNLHQAIITGSHISYCLRGGIKIIGSEIRNIQITGNDIEYNYDTTAEASADIWIDSSDGKATVREGTIASNTIQARYSPGGANVRMIGENPENNHRAGMFTIAGNIIGSQETNLHLVACRGVAVTGNIIYSGHSRNVVLDGSRNIVLSGNSFDHNPDYGSKELCTGVRFENSRDVVFSGSIVHDCQTGKHTVATQKPLERTGLVEVVGCERININGCQILDGTPVGIDVADSKLVQIAANSILETRAVKQTAAAVRFRGTGSGHYVTGNLLADGEVSIAEGCEVTVGENAGLEKPKV